MIDINAYISRIGLFNPKPRDKKYLYKSQFYKKSSWNESHAGRNAMLLMNTIFKIVLIFGLLMHYETDDRCILSSDSVASINCPVQAIPVCVVEWGANYRGEAGPGAVRVVGWGDKLSALWGWHEGGLNNTRSLEIIDYNFLARYKNGNIQKKKGILNMHLNIRSLLNKVSEVKNVIKQHNPFIMGISECELKRDRVNEKVFKIPGYDILYPKSWNEHGYARVVVYIKKTFKYEQVHELEDDHIQSVWIKGGQRNSKNIYFCHAYREHLSTLGAAAQREYMSTFLSQWDAATQHGGSDEPNETHISGDLNIDILNGRWLQSDYHLISLSRMLKTTCNVGNFHQLVKDVTRVQFNSVTSVTDMSCIEHVYTNARFRCSEAEVTSFGDSDHDIVSYTRYSKNPPIPARIVCKRSYKDFDSEAFKSDVERTDWSDVYSYDDVDLATECLTRKLRYILNVHAPWVRVQHRKFFVPWITDETKELIVQRDLWKKKAKDLALISPMADQNQKDA